MPNRNENVIIGLTLFTALIHLYLGISSLVAGDIVFSTLFALNFLGYIVLLFSLFFLPEILGSRSALGLTLMIYAGLTIFAYIYVWGISTGDFSQLISGLGLVTKFVEILIIVFVGIEILGNNVTDSEEVVSNSEEEI